MFHVVFLYTKSRYLQIEIVLFLKKKRDKFKKGIYVEPEKNWYRQSYLQSRNRDTGVVQEGQET